MTLSAHNPKSAEPRVDAEPSCLLIIPRHFYSFEKHIREGLEAHGYIVTVANDEYPEGMLGKIIGKLQIPTIYRSTRRVFEQRYIANRKYDLVLIFKGRGMSPRLIAALRSISYRVVGYNWDSFQLNRSPLQWLAGTSKYYTFDYRDAKTHTLPVIELFSATTRRSGAPKRIEYDVCAIFRNHSARLKYLDEVLKALEPESAYVAIFELNAFTFIYNVLRHPWLYWKYRRYVTFRPVPYAEYERVMQASRFTIDYAHDTQTGITMRCFEAVNSMTKIITNNPYMKNSPHFAPADYVIHEMGASPEQLRAWYKSAGGTLYQSQPRTVVEFVGDLLRE